MIPQVIQAATWQYFPQISLCHFPGAKQTATYYYYLNRNHWAKPPRQQTYNNQRVKEYLHSPVVLKMPWFVHHFSHHTSCTRDEFSHGSCCYGYFSNRYDLSVIYNTRSIRCTKEISLDAWIRHRQLRDNTYSSQFNEQMSSYSLELKSVGSFVYLATCWDNLLEHLFFFYNRQFNLSRSFSQPIVVPRAGVLGHFLSPLLSPPLVLSAGCSPPLEQSSTYAYKCDLEQLEFFGNYHPINHDINIKINYFRWTCLVNTK